MKQYFALMIILFFGFPLFAGSEPILNYKIWKTVDWSSSDGSIYCIQFTPENFPLNVPLNFTCEWLDGRGMLFKMFIDKDNQLFSIKSKDEPFLLTLSDFMKGEPIECLLSSEDKKVSASITIIPIPLQSKDDAGHVLSLQMLTPTNEIFKMTATGFKPFEIVEYS